VEKQIPKLNQKISNCGAKEQRTQKMRAECFGNYAKIVNKIQSVSD